MLPHGYEQPTSMVLLLGGVLACFAGYRLFRIVLGIYGFILGAMIASSVVGMSNTTGMLLTAIIGGLIGSVVLVMYLLYAWLSGRSIQGWTSLMLIVVVIGAAQMFVLGLMGEYIGRLYNESKRRPLYIVQEMAGGEHRDPRLGYVADATANSDKPGVSGTRPIK